MRPVFPRNPNAQGGGESVRPALQVAPRCIQHSIDTEEDLVHDARIALGWVVGVAATAVLVGCGGNPSTPTGPSSVASPGSSSPAAESNPAGDIPDNQAYVTYVAPDHSFTLQVPEGWAQTTSATTVVFTDKFNSITLTPRSGFYAPDEEYARTVELPEIASSTKGYVAGDVTTVDRKSGRVVLITYQSESPPSPVTGKTVAQAVERYEFAAAGREVVVTLSGPAGADNVDPWRTVSDSFTWTP